MVFLIRERCGIEFHAIPIDNEDFYIDKYLNDPSYEDYYYNCFVEWYNELWRYKTSRTSVTTNGEFISYSNNSRYTVVEAKYVYDAIDKARKIFKQRTKAYHET